MNWFHDVSRLVDMLFLGSHVGPGGVARGTEMATLSMENVKTSQRNLYVMHGYLVAALRYNKTQHSTQMDKLIARFIPPRFGRILLYYIAIVRPLERIWSEEAFGRSKSDAYRHLVFVRYATPMESVQFSRILHDSTLEHLDVGLGLRDYRQFIKSVLRTVLQIDYDKVEDQLDITDASFGHSSNIGETFYGLSCTDLPNLSNKMFCLHQEFCQRFHRWLGEGEPLPGQCDPLSTTEMTTMFNNMRSLVEKTAEHRDSLSQESIVSAVREVALDAIKESIQNTLAPVIQRSIRTEIHDTLVNMHQFYYPGGDSDTHIPESCLLPVTVQPSTLKSLRRLFGSNASPKSPEHVQILQLILDRRYHVIGILPTGGGKGALYQVPSSDEQTGMTICIFPVQALVQDQMLQARRLGISVATWPEHYYAKSNKNAPYMQHVSINHDQTRLVCISAHHVGHDEFLPWLKALRGNGILTRVVFNEAHQFLTGNFGSCIPNLHQIQQLDVPILCLSGSLTPAAIPPLIKLFGFPPSQLRIVRADTPRPSISYHAIRVAEEDLFTAVVREIKAFFLEPEERGLIFCNSNDCEYLSLLTGVPVFHGHSDEWGECADMWHTGETQRLICTNGFGNATDNPRVRHAIHCKAPMEMDRYVQETGQIGRDGKKSRAVMFYTGIPSANNVTPPDTAGRLAMVQYLSQTNQCKRVEMSRWLDGEKRIHSCSSIPFAELCDWCLTCS